ncbi:MAG: IS701 family transposase [Synechococcaceae cyanobacterium RM1_1_27]|nr:IS701 family transposase [Synechococcaceae cyanobacterium SM2_3_2]NJO86095.1 IS701 family transposase [Synechococcaceae cyanobacterium RM1_1_27]
MTLARQALPTLQVIDDYCEAYRPHFPEVRSFEFFKLILLGLLSPMKRKSLPAIARHVGVESHQSLHHFLTQSPWLVSGLQAHRLQRTLEWLGGRSIYLLVDETGDPKKGKSTDYVARQYIGRLGKIENGIVSVSVWGVVDNIVFPLVFDIYKPENRLKVGDRYQSKPEIALHLVKKVMEKGFVVDLVLADSLYGESSTFLNGLEEMGLEYIVSIRSNHGVWMLPGERLRRNRWRRYERIFADGTKEERYIREVIFGHRMEKRYWELTKDPKELLEEGTFYLMTKKKEIDYQAIGNLYGKRSWIEYGYKQSKDELGWSDYRLTHYQDIEKWWEMVYQALLLVSFICDGNRKNKTRPREQESREEFRNNPRWEEGKSWKSQLNNLHLLIEPWNYLSNLASWLRVYTIPELSIGLSRLIQKLNSSRWPWMSTSILFSSA